MENIWHDLLIRHSFVMTTNVANSNIAVGEILEVLSATKTAVKNTYNQNEYNNLCGEHR